MSVSRESDSGQLAEPQSDTLRTLSVGGGRQRQRYVWEMHPSQSQPEETSAQSKSGEPVTLYLRTEGGGGLYAGNNTPKHSNKEDQMQRSMHRRSRGVHSGKGLTFHINAARKSNVHFVFFKRN